MAKVLVERPRWIHYPHGRGSPYPRGKLAGIFERDLDNAPTRLGMKVGHADKWLNENLAPLRRFLLGQVGRPWDRVRSEIARHVRRTNAVQAHIYQHLDEYVLTRVTMKDGIPHAMRWGKLQPLVERWRGTPLWVCPKSGLLRGPLRARPEPVRFGQVLRMDQRHELRQIEGRWQHVTLRPLELSRLAEGIFDVLLGQQLEERHFDHRAQYKKLFGRDDAYAIGTRTPGKREACLVKAARTR